MFKNIKSLLNLLFIIGLVSFVFFVYLQIQNIKKEDLIIGKWKGSSETVEVDFKLADNFDCDFVIRDLSTGKITEQKGFCNFDFSKDPHPLDIRNTQEGTMFTIVRFTSIDTIKIARFAKKWRLRPISFNGNDLILTRMEDNNG